MYDDIDMGTRDVLAANIRAIKQYLGMSNLKLAKHCGVSNGTIGRAVLGQVAIDLDSLSLIAEACHLHPWQLLTPNLDPKSPPVITQLTESERKLYSKLAKAMANDKATQ